MGGTMTVQADGLVGIGTTIPTRRLDVAGDAVVRSSLAVSGAGLSGSAPIFQVMGGTMTVQADGRLGVGTATPQAQVEIVSAGGSSLRIDTSNAGYVSLRVGGTEVARLKP